MKVHRSCLNYYAVNKIIWLTICLGACYRTQLELARYLDELTVLFAAAIEALAFILAPSSATRLLFQCSIGFQNQKITSLKSEKKRKIISSH
jgi:hypothetical protein